MKKLTDDYKPEKSTVFEQEDTLKRLQEAKDDEHLFIKLTIIFLYGEC